MSTRQQQTLARPRRSAPQAVDEVMHLNWLLIGPIQWSNSGEQKLIRPAHHVEVAQRSLLPRRDGSPVGSMSSFKIGSLGFVFFGGNGGFSRIVLAVPLSPAFSFDFEFLLSFVIAIPFHSSHAIILKRGAMRTYSVSLGFVKTDLTGYGDMTSGRSTAAGAV